MDNLPREVLQEGSPLLEKDCAVCKEQFVAVNEEPDDQVVVTLPCKHPFHEGCIIPWLKSSGTCPVCRFALIPQPNSHPPGPSTGPPGAPGPEPGPGPNSSQERRDSGSNVGTGGANRDSTGSGGGGHQGGFFSSLFGGHHGHQHRQARSPTGTDSHLSERRSLSPPRPFPPIYGNRGTDSADQHSHSPGAWGDQD